MIKCCNMASVISKIYTMVTLSLSIIISIFAAEYITRKVFGNANEINGQNLRVDPNIGYIVNSDLKDVDEFGFRNEKNVSSDYVLAAIGDSHTYGYNVHSDMSWPAQLSRQANIKIYNFGIGGNGIYSYHYLVTEELKKNKLVIVGLYIANDFSHGGYVCDVNFFNSFWETQKLRLNLETPICDAEINPSIVQKIINKSAFLSLIKEYLLRPIKNKILLWSGRSIYISEQINPISVSHLEAVSNATDLSDPHTHKIFNDFRKMLVAWKNLSKSGQLGVILIPSAQVVYRSAVENLDFEAEDAYIAPIIDYTNNELLLERILLSELEELNIPSKSIRRELSIHLLDSISNESNSKIYPDTHPSAQGYKIYSDSARMILDRMKMQSEILIVD